MVPRAQSAIEYLMTYGWAILIIVVVLAIFLALNVFNNSIFITNNCASSQGFVCSNPVLNASGYLAVTVSRYGQALNITGLACVGNTSIPRSFAPVSIEMKESYTYSFIFVCQLPRSSIGSSFTGYIWMQYNEAGQSGLVSEIGAVSTSVQSSMPLTTSSTTTSTTSTSTTTTSTTSTTTSTTTTSTTSTIAPSAYVYCFGGNDNDGYHVAAQTASIYPNGSMTWNSAEFSLPVLLSGGGGCAAYGGYAYCIGSSYPANTFYSAPLVGNAVGPWTVQTSLPYSYISEGDNSCSASSGYLYCTARNLSGSSTNVILAASISSGTVGAWTIAANYSYPGRLSATGGTCFIYQGYFYCLGVGNSGNSAYYAQLSSPTSIGPWTSTNGEPNTNGNFQSPCSEYNGYLFCVGDTPSSSQSYYVYSAPMLSPGIGAWTQQNSTPVPITFQAPTCGAIAGRLYCFGNDGGTESSVYEATVSGGTVGSWAMAGNVPLNPVGASCVGTGHGGGYLGLGAEN